MIISTTLWNVWCHKNTHNWPLKASQIHACVPSPFNYSQFFITILMFHVERLGKELFMLIVKRSKTSIQPLNLFPH